MILQWIQDYDLEIGAILIALVAVAVATMALRKAGRAVAWAKHAQWHRAAPPGPSPDVQKLRAEVQLLTQQLDQFHGELVHVRSLVRSVHEAPPAAPTVAAPAAPAPPAAPVPEIVAPAWPAEAPSDPVGRPVEYDGVDLRLSRSLSALGSLVVSGDPDGQATLFVNDQIQIDHVAIERWSHLFDFRGGRAYASYRTVKPAIVEWNEGAGTGRLVSRGLAEVVS